MSSPAGGQGTGTAGGDNSTPSSKKKIKQSRWDQFFKENPQTVNAAISATNLAELEAALDQILNAVRNDADGWGKSAELEQMLAYFGRASDLKLGGIVKRRQQLRGAGSATFNEKRMLMKSTLRLNCQELIMERNPLKITLNRKDTKGLNRKYLLDSSLAKHVEAFGAEARKKGHIMVGGTDWTIIEKDQSCIIRNSDGGIEFIAMRGAAGQDDIIDMIAKNVEEAAGNFRGLRPGDPGSITAFGVSAGPRHCRMFGYAKNLLRPQNFKNDEILEFHHKLLAGATIVWKLAESRLPRDLMAGAGFSFMLGEKKYEFPESPRCPPEVYHSQNYSSLAHQEHIYTDFAIAYHALRQEESTGDLDSPPFGGDFVDVGLKVLMRANSDTLFAFRAKNLHGTTPMRGIQQFGVVFPFSERIVEAYKKANNTETIVLEDVVEAPPGASVVEQNI